MSTSKATVANTGTFNTPHGTGSMFGQVANGGNDTMPYTGANDPKLPKNVQALPEGRREQWSSVWNAAFEKCQKAGGDDCEGAAFQTANGVVLDKKSVEVEQPEAEKQAAQPASADPVQKALADGNDHFLVLKQDDGSYRWASISSVAVKDKEFEIVTEKAQDDAIQHANDTGEFGEIDLVHVDGTDVGKCDLMARVGNKLVEGGTFDNTDMALGAIKAIEDDPDYWGISIQFVYDPSKFDGEKYLGNIRIKKRTILPQEMAASYGTRLVAIGGEQPMEKQALSDKAREALEKLNVAGEEIEKLAEKQVDVEPNTVNKEAEVEVETPEPEVEEESVEVAETPEPETAGAEKSRLVQILDAVKAAFSKPEAEKADEPDAETGGEETAEVEPVEAQETKEVDLTEVFKGLLDVYTEATVTAVADALKKQQEAHDAQVGSLGEALLLVSEQVKTLQAPIEDRIEKRLAELPPIVKAAPSMTASLEEPKEARLPVQGKTTNVNYVNELVKSVNEVTAKLGSTPAIEV